MTHGADGAWETRSRGDAAEGGGDHVTVLQGGDEARTLCGIVPQPMQQLREAPLRRVDASAPVDGFELLLVRGGGNLLCLAPRAVIAPEIVVIQRLEPVADRDDAGTGGVDSECADLIAADAAGAKRTLHGLHERVHLRTMTLRCEIGILRGAMQRILRNARAEPPFRLAEERDTHAQCAEIDTRNDAHRTGRPRQRRLRRCWPHGQRRLRRGLWVRFLWSPIS